MPSKKKTALITGASTGIGEATARFLAQKGWTVFAGVRTDADSQKLRSQDINIKPVILDVTKEDQVRSAIEEVRAAVGDDGLDALINNAGFALFGPIEYALQADIMLQFDVNLFGAIRMIQAAMPLIRMGTPGRVISIGSVASEFKFPFAGIYEASKSALITLSESLRREVEPFGIKVAIIIPGPVRTQAMKTASDKYSAFKTQMTGNAGYEQHYGKTVDTFFAGMQAMNAGGIEASELAHRVHQVLMAKHPKGVYFDTWSSWWGVKKIGLMPHKWVDSSIKSFSASKE